MANGTIVGEWNKKIICPVHKNWDRLNCNNYRGIRHNTVYKVLSKILYTRLIPYTENIIGPYQCGFRPGRFMTDQIFVLMQIIEKLRIAT